MDFSSCDLLQLDEGAWLLVAATGLSVYDFPFDRYFPSRRAPYRTEPITAIARVGAIEDYANWHAAATSEGITLIHSPEEHERCSTLPGWYPRLSDLTARTEIYEAPPPVSVVEQRFGWPVFMKGIRQTARHQKALSVLRSPRDYEHAAAVWSSDPILSWQAVAVREFLPLRPIVAPVTDRIAPSFEFRAFVWRGEVVGFGPYWWDAPAYDCTAREREEALRVVRAAARRVDVPFLVVDVAQQLGGRWVVIECNDGQESGYAGASPFAVWQAIVAREQERG